MAKINESALNHEKATLKFINFSKRYGNSAKLSADHVNLEVNGGEIFGFLGPNGAGKSTCIKTTIGIQPVTEGEIEESADGFLAADFPDRLYFSVITVRIEACSDPGMFAASFQEANAGRYLPLPPSRKALARMERIKRLLGE